ncbi:MAG: hypothetical protein IPP37_21600 [Saprospiraceae bacterium]|nr:hypothetical protein [Saprospiraceae bacterium]
MGQAIGYTIVVTNTGNQTQTGVNVGMSCLAVAGTLSGPTESVSSNGQFERRRNMDLHHQLHSLKADIDLGANW